MRNQQDMSSDPVGSLRRGVLGSPAAWKTATPGVPWFGARCLDLDSRPETFFGRSIMWVCPFSGKPFLVGRQEGHEEKVQAIVGSHTLMAASSLGSNTSPLAFFEGCFGMFLQPLESSKSSPRPLAKGSYL